MQNGKFYHIFLASINENNVFLQGRKGTAGMVLATKQTTFTALTRDSLAVIMDIH